MEMRAGGSGPSAVAQNSINAHMQGWAGYYTGCVQHCNRRWIELRAYLRASRDWTYPVERCMFRAVQLPTHAFVHFNPVRCTQYIVCSAT